MFLFFCFSLAHPLTNFSIALQIWMKWKAQWVIVKIISFLSLSHKNQIEPGESPTFHKHSEIGSITPGATEECNWIPQLTSPFLVPEIHLESMHISLEFQVLISKLPITYLMKKSAYARSLTPSITEISVIIKWGCWIKIWNH